MRREALSRTLLLARRVIGDFEVPDAEVLEALARTRVAIVCDEANLRSWAARYLITTLSRLVTSEGCSTRLVPANIDSRAFDEWATLAATTLASSGRVIPGSTATLAHRTTKSDLVFVVGDTQWEGEASHAWRLIGDSWSGAMRQFGHSGHLWDARLPFGAGIAAAIASAEPFKAALRSVCRKSCTAPPVPELLESTPEASFEIQGAGERTAIDLGRVDFVSAGAITSCAMHVLLNVPGLRMQARIFDNDRIERSNFNRYPLVERSDIGRPKVDVIASRRTEAIEIVPVPLQVNFESINSLEPLAPRVVVGADSIPVRWLIQSLEPAWLGVGATAEFMTLTSEHPVGWPCAGCLHPADDDLRAVVPTVSFVSYWAGLLVAARLIANVFCARLDPGRQALLQWALRMDLPTSVQWVAVTENVACPLHHAA